MAKKGREKKPKQDRMWIVATVVLLLFIACVLYLDYSKKKASENPSPSEITTSTPTAPPSTLYPLVPDAEIQAALDSGNPAVLYFYSTTCGTCVEAHDNLLALEEKLKPYHVVLIKVSYTDNQSIFDKLGTTTSTIIAWKGKEVLKESFTAQTNADEMLKTILQKFGIG